MRKSKIKQISLAVCLTLMPFSIYAAGLGKLDVSSGLGEPLKAEIELLSVSPEELSTLAASIGSEEAYAAQGITRLGVHSDIKVELAKNNSGAPILKLRSNQPVSDPYLDMLIQVDWATGRLQREYTVLLDPPGYKPASVDELAPVQLPLVNTKQTDNISTAVSTFDNDVATPPPVKSKRTKRQNKPAASTPDASLLNEVEPNVEADQLVTKSGDNLSTIAKKMQVDGVSLDQMLAGLYESNQDAFIKGNMNRLKVGQIIKVPTKESFDSISKKEARKVVKAHSVNWNAYRNNLASAIAAAPVATEVEHKQSVTGKIVAAEDKAAVAKTGPQDVVKLSAGGKDTSKAFDSKILALQEETTAREKSLLETESRAVALEKQIKDMQKLMALKNQSMSELQKNVEEAVKAPEAKPIVKPEVKPEVKKVEPLPVVKKVEPVPVVVPQVQKVEAVAEPSTPVQEEPSFFEGLMGYTNFLAVMSAGLIALLLAGWVYLRNKRRKDLDSFERGILTSGGLRANTVFGNTNSNVSISDSSFLTDFAQSADGSMMDTNDVDPIAEAEVYMAYGRDAQAEEILKDAIVKEPKRYELHLKLLEMYAARKEPSAFEAVAGELYTTLGAAHPVWAKAAALGLTVDPTNPLYDLTKTVVMPPANTPSLPPVSDAPLATTQIPKIVQNVQHIAALADTEVSNKISSASSTLDDGFQLDSSMPTASVESILDNSLEFDMGSFTNTDATVNVANSLPALDLNTSKESLHLGMPDFLEVNESATGNTDLDDLSMNFDLTTSSDKNVLDFEVEETAMPIDDISFDLDFAPEVSGQTLASVAEEASTSDISFDLPSEPVVDDVKLEPNTFNLSSISLDLDGTENELASTKSAEDQSIAEVATSGDIADESADVNIKLDLVAAYIDMEDKEGALELLEEIMKEGGTQQKLRAQVLLNSLA